MKAGIGLDVGSTAVRLAAVRLNRSGPVLVAYAREAMHEGEGMGDIVDPLALTETVKAMLKTLKLPKAPVNLGMVNQRMVARDVELPWVPEKELKPALPILASDLLPMPVEESVLDFLPAEEVIDPDGTRMMRGLLLAANEEIVTIAVEAVERAGLTVDRVDFAPLGALHSVCDPASPQVEALLDVGADTTSLVVHEGNHPSFVRVMARGGNSVTESLADQFGIEMSQAELWKHGVGGMWPTMSAQDQANTRAALDTASSSLIDEIRSSVMFYRTNSGHRLDRIWLIGGGGVQFGLDYQLRDALRTEVLHGMPIHRLAGSDVPPGVIASQSEAATAIGLALAVAR